MITVLDVVANKYLTIESPNFRIHTSPMRAGAREMLPDFYEFARKDYGERYGYVSPKRVEVEVFRRFDDSPVRSVGFAGFGALGVCFGR